MYIPPYGRDIHHVPSAYLFVQRASHTEARLVQDMRVNHCRGYILVSEKLLNSAYIITCLQKVRGETVTKCVYAYPFGNTGHTRCLFDRPLKALLAHVVASYHP